MSKCWQTACMWWRRRANANALAGAAALLAVACGFVALAMPAHAGGKGGAQAKPVPTAAEAKPAAAGLPADPSAAARERYFRVERAGAPIRECIWPTSGEEEEALRARGKLFGTVEFQPRDLPRWITATGSGFPEVRADFDLKGDPRAIRFFVYNGTDHEISLWDLGGMPDLYVNPTGRTAIVSWSRLDPEESNNTIILKPRGSIARTLQIDPFAPEVAVFLDEHAMERSIAVEAAYQFQAAGAAIGGSLPHHVIRATGKVGFEFFGDRVAQELARRRANRTK